ncbi:MAG TPA: hypothetical protein VK081_09430 [Planctomycetota bacterium]|nr:hypothetical protein [Planctomycetota bacterium]
MHPSLPSFGAAALLLAPVMSAQLVDRAALSGGGVIPIHTAAPEQDGTPYGIWAAGRDYKVSFHDGFAFTPYLGDAVRENVVVRWQTAAVTVGGVPVADVAAPPTTAHSDYRFEYRWGDLVEAYDVRADGVEQTFVLYRRPAVAGDLVVSGWLRSSLTVPAMVAAAHGPVALCDGHARTLVEYGAAFALDARGARLPLTTLVGPDGRVELRVPADFVRAARYPLVVDPIVRTVLRTESPANGLVQTDIGRDDARNRLLIAYSRKASATDSDLYLELRDDAYNLLNTVFFDVNSLWSNPNAAIAYVGGANRWVTAIERKFSDGRSGIRVNVRDAASSAVDNSVLVHSVPQNESHAFPDAGGIASNHTGNHALVVFQQRMPNSNAHEVLGMIVDASARSLGTPRVMAGFANNGNLDRRLPAVNQEALDASDGWLVAYQEQQLNVTNDDVDVLYVRVGHDGNLLSTSRVQSALNTGTSHKMGPKVAGQSGRYLIAFSIDESSSRPAVPTTPEGTSVVFEALRWQAGNITGLTAGHLRRHTRSTRQWVVDSVAFDTRTRTFWAAAFHSVTTGDCSISRHGYDAGEVEKRLLADPSQGESGFGASVCFDDDAGVFKSTCVRNTSGQSALVAADFVHTAIAPQTFGISCGGRVGTNGTNLAGSDTFEFTLSQATPNAPAVIVLGTDRAATPLDPIGMPGCALAVLMAGAAVTLPMSTNAQGSAALPVKLPANPVPVYGRVVAQFLFFAPGQNPLQVLATGGVEVLITLG